MVEWTALEMRRTGNRTGGSNPSLSAKERPTSHIVNAGRFLFIIRKTMAFLYSPLLISHTHE